jgi:membrane-bound serine protease (ClpP class)
MQDPELLLMAYGLIAAGLIMLVAELFLPSGVLLVLSILALFVGMVLTFKSSPNLGLVTLIGLFIVVPLAGKALLHLWPKTAAGKRFFLSGPDEDATVASMPVNLELEDLRGRFGRTLAPLRPAGITDFDGRRVDTITEGMMVEAGQWVRCIDVRAGKVIVRPVDKPDLEKLESAEL